MSEADKIAEEDRNFGKIIGDRFLALLEALGDSFGQDIQQEAFGNVALV